MKLGQQVHSSPTIGFNVETIDFKNIKFTIKDIGGNISVRPLWKNYYADMNCLIFVVDSSDQERLSETKEIIHNLNRDFADNIPFLILANKKDKSKETLA